MCDLSYDGDRVDVWTMTWRKARKQHDCHCCGIFIQAGERYQIITSIDDGEVNTEKCCKACSDVLEEFGKEHSFYPFPTSLHEFLVECVRDDYGKDSKRWRDAANAIEARARFARAPRWKAYLAAKDADAEAAS